MKKQENIEVPTPEQIEEWKLLHGSVYRLKKEAEGDEPEAYCWLRSPKRKEITYAQKANDLGGKLAFNESIINSCWLAGDLRFKTVDSWFLGAGAQIAEIIEIKEVSLEKL